MLPSMPSSHAFTLIELVMTLAILAIMSAISIPLYSNYRERLDNNQAITDIKKISVVIQRYLLKHGEYPETLSEVNMSHLQDPWGNPYQYLNIASADGSKPRKDRSLKPINSDYDLYSMGKDGETRTPITARNSLDDIIRASNGGYVGRAEDY